MQVTSLMMCKHFWLLNKAQSTNLHKFRIDWQTTIFAEHFGANNVILCMVQNLSCAKLRVVFCGIYYVTTVTINGINRMHMLSVYLQPCFVSFGSCILDFSAVPSSTYTKLFTSLSNNCITQLQQSTIITHLFITTIILRLAYYTGSEYRKDPVQAMCPCIQVSM